VVPSAVCCAQVKVPNHTLFFEKVFNLSETSGAVQDFIIAFNMVGLENADMVRDSHTRTPPCRFVCMCCASQLVLCYT
jgi:hypothetical protein